MKTVSYCIAVLLLVQSPSASAALIPLNNPGFEALMGTDTAHFQTDGITPGQLLEGHFSATLDLGPNTFITTTPIPGWQGNAYGGTLNPTTTMFPGEAAEGQHVGGIFGLGYNYSQQTTFALQPGTYTFTVAYGNPLDQTPSGRIWITAGANFLVDSGIGGLVEPAEGTWEERSIQVVIPGSHPYLGSLVGVGIANSAGYALFDDARLEFTPVPEPGMLALGVSGIGCILLIRRRC